MKAGETYSLPSYLAQILSDVAIPNLIGSNAEPGVLVNGGFISSPSNANVVVKKHTIGKQGASSNYAASVMEDRPSYYWRLNEPSGTVAQERIQGLNGTITGGVTVNQPGALVDGDKCMVFDGVSGKIVTSGNSTIPAIFSFEVWFKTVSTSQVMPLFDTQGVAGAGNNIYSIKINPTGVPTTNYNFSYDIGAGYGAAANFLPSIADGQWHHLVWVFPAGLTSNLYIDGKLVASPALSGPALSGVTARPISIGFDSTYIVYANGSIDEVAIYPYALTPTQIQSHYKARSPYPTDSYATKVIASGPSNYWRLDETYGIVAKDIIGGANGTIGGGVILNGESGMTFNGAQTISVPASVSIPVTVTFEAWIKLVDLLGNYPIWGNWEVIGATGDTLEFGPAVGGKLWVRVGPGVADVFSTVAPLVAGAWQHVVYVLNGSQILYYTNGILVDTKAATRANPSAGPSIIGVGSGVGNFKGSIDELAFYPRALTAAEILDHYRAR